MAWRLRKETSKIGEENKTAKSGHKCKITSENSSGNVESPAKKIKKLRDA